MSFSEFPASAAWRHHEAREGFESVFLRADRSGHRLDGHTAAVEEGQAWVVRYVISLDERWITRTARVWGWSLKGEHEVVLEADGSCGGGTSLHVYESPANAGKATATLATWNVADLDQVVDELSAAGLTFERYDDPALASDEKGIHTLPDGKVAWFKDPDGNTFAIEQ